MLASNDVHVARFYYRRGATLAAVNRAQAVVKQYQEAPAIEEALAIMMNGYEQLGLSELSADARRVLQKNFPASVYLKSAYDPTVKKPVAVKPPAAPITTTPRSDSDRISRPTPCFSKIAASGTCIAENASAP